MDKQEIERRIKKYELVRECAEENLNELNIQLRDIREAGKPKLRHGDFGITTNNSKFFFNDGNRELSKSCPDKSIYEYENKEFDFSTAETVIPIIFGNIFDLMKEWGEDLEEFVKSCVGGGSLKISPCRNRIQFCIRAKNDHRYATATISEAEEIWHKLGQMIATLKRKNAQE